MAAAVISSSGSPGTTGRGAHRPHAGSGFCITAPCRHVLALGSGRPCVAPSMRLPSARQNFSSGLLAACPKLTATKYSCTIWSARVLPTLSSHCHTESLPTASHAAAASKLPCIPPLVFPTVSDPEPGKNK